MKQEMQINPKAVAKSEVEFREALDYFEKLRADRPYFIGEQFSRVDLTVASLLGAFHWPENTSVNDGLRQIFQRYKDHPLVQLVKRTYDQHYLLDTKKNA